MKRQNKIAKGNSCWIVKTIRPEEKYLDPSVYFNNEEVEKYARSSGMRNAQQHIAQRILDLICLDRSNERHLLDLGCGVGYTTEFYKGKGYNVTGLDVLPKMLEHAKSKGLTVFQGDMRDLQELFEKEKFDGVVSASALQWLTQEEDLKKVAYGINYVLKKQGKGVIQFYPKSEQALNEVQKTFKKRGLFTEIVIDNPENPKKRVNYLVMHKI